MGESAAVESCQDEEWGWEDEGGEWVIQYHVTDDWAWQKNSM